MLESRIDFVFRGNYTGVLNLIERT